MTLKSRMGSPAKRHQITVRETQNNKRKGKKSHRHKKKSREKRENIQESKRLWPAAAAKGLEEK